MTRRRSSDHRRPRWGTAAAVLLLHLVVVAALIRAFTPDLAERAVRSMTRAITVTVTPPTPEPTPSPQPAPRKAAPRSAGAAGAPGRKAPVPTPAIAPPVPPVVVAPSPVPVAAGASASGTASGASGTGAGFGAGSAGTGTGGGGAMPAVKIAGEISSARDYPRAGRDLRVGSSVVIDLAVGPDGRVRGCRVLQPSPDPEAGRITCDLATTRFRFRPARDAAGNAVGAVYRWRQRWFY